jgi:hypothetical protein
MIEISDYLSDPPPEEVLPAWGTMGAGGVLGDQNQWYDVHHVEGFGWPMLAMACVYGPGASRGTTVRARLGIETSQTRMVDSNGATYVKTLPVVPIWPGFVFNAVAFAIAFWMSMFAPFIIRRNLRCRRGYCIQCGYDLRGQYVAGCPECGWNR